MQKVFKLLLKDQHTKLHNGEYYNGINYVLSEQTTAGGKTLEKKSYDIETQMIYSTVETGDGKTRLNVQNFSDKGALEGIPAVFQKYFAEGGDLIPISTFPQVTVDVAAPPKAKAALLPFRP